MLVDQNVWKHNIFFCFLKHFWILVDQTLPAFHYVHFPQKGKCKLFWWQKQWDCFKWKTKKRRKPTLLEWEIIEWLCCWIVGRRFQMHLGWRKKWHFTVLRSRIIGKCSLSFCRCFQFNVFILYLSGCVHCSTCLDGYPIVYIPKHSISKWIVRQYIWFSILASK